MPHTEPPPQPPEIDSRRISGRLVVLGGLLLAAVFLVFTYMLRPSDTVGQGSGTGAGTGAAEAGAGDGSAGDR